MPELQGRALFRPKVRDDTAVVPPTIMFDKATLPAFAHNPLGFRRTDICARDFGIPAKAVDPLAGTA